MIKKLKRTKVKIIKMAQSKKVNNKYVINKKTLKVKLSGDIK